MKEITVFDYVKEDLDQIQEELGKPMTYSDIVGYLIKFRRSVLWACMEEETETIGG